tara:strand:- start:2478 stop:4658 length:2181 start_codon:yes stop_codon:yes gene_type:complete
MNFKDYLDKNSIITFLFSIIIILIFYFNLPINGIMGGDWTFPYDERSFVKWIEISSWNSKSNFGDDSTLSLNMFYYKLIVNLFYLIGVPINKIQFVIVNLFFILGQISFVILLKYYLNLEKKVDIFLLNLFSLFFIFSPINFNFLTIGWIFSNISYLLLPLFVFCLLKSIKKNSNKYVFFAAIIFSISLLQAQSIAWYLLASLIFIFDRSLQKKIFLQNLVKIFLITFLLNIHWIFPILLDQQGGEKVFPNLSKSLETTSMDINLNYFNIFKFYSTTYNGFFEYWIKEHFNYFSYFISLIPILLIFLLIKDSNNKFYKFFLSYVFFIINSLILVNILKSSFLIEFEFLSPFRNLSRTIVILPFLFYFLIICLLIPKFKLLDKKKKYLLIFLICLNSLNIFPWVKDLSYSKNEEINIDSKIFKLRSHELNDDYHDFYNKLYLEKNKYTRSLFFPYGSLINFSDNPLFLGSFFSVVDIYSVTSAIPGLISVGSERFSSSKSFVLDNFYYNYDTKFTKQLFKNLYTVDLFIYRKNIPSRNIFTLNEFKNFFSNKKLYKLYYESKNITAYERIKKNSLLETVNLKNKNSNYNEFLDNKDKIDFIREKDSIIFIKKIDSKKDTLIFNESYSNNWCLMNVEEYQKVNFLFRKLLILKNYFSLGCNTNHAKVFLYSNAWKLDKKEDIILIFKPQIGYIVAIYFYGFLTIFLIFFSLRKLFTKKLKKIKKIFQG